MQRNVAAAASVLLSMPMPVAERRLAVVPAYNEVATVGERGRGAAPRRARAGTCIVDRRRVDGRHGGAWPSAAGARVVRLPFNLGIGGAVQAGFRFARDEGYDLMVQVDARRPARSRARSAGSLRGARGASRGLDMVCGSRFLSADHRYPAPISRRTGIHLFAFLLSRIVGQRVSDPTSGFRLYNRRAIGLFARDYPHDYPEVEAVLMLHHHRLTHARGARADVRARRRPVVDPARASPSTT